MAADDLNPRSGKRTVELTYRELVEKADPDRRQELRRELEYVFAGGRRCFYANRAERAAYAPDDGAPSITQHEGVPLTTSDGSILNYE